LVLSIPAKKFVGMKTTKIFGCQKEQKMPKELERIYIDKFHNEWQITIYYKNHVFPTVKRSNLTDPHEFFQWLADEALREKNSSTSKNRDR
jgi:hypothetical protein